MLHGLDLSGSVAVVTGANSGIGYETARSLAFHGCQVVLACRSAQRANRAVELITRDRPNARCEAMELDLASLASVRAFAQKFTTSYSRCDKLVLNAGVFLRERSITQDGFDEVLQVNFLSQLYLAILLQPLLSRSRPSRVVFVSAEAHRFGDASTSFEGASTAAASGEYSGAAAYATSKLWCVMAAVEMQRRFGDQGICAYACHPGNLVSTRLARNSLLLRALQALVRPFAKSLQQACASSVYCAASPDLAAFGGVYVCNCVPLLPAAAALDAAAAARLWKDAVAAVQGVLGRRAFSVNASLDREAAEHGEVEAGR